MPEYLTTQEAAKLMKVSSNKVRSLCRQGVLPGVFQERKNGPWKISVTSAQTWLETHASPKSKSEAVNTSKSEPFWQRGYVVGIVAVVTLLAGIAGFWADSGIKDRIFPETVAAEPTRIVVWDDIRADHLVRGPKFRGACGHAADLYPTATLNYSAILERGNAYSALDKIDSSRYPLAPVGVFFKLGQEIREDLDQVVVNDILLNLESYSPFEETFVLILDQGPCTDPIMPIDLFGDLVINPSIKQYSLLKPRITSPDFNRPFSITSGYAELGFYINALEPGIYTLSTTVVYTFNGQRQQSSPLYFSLAVLSDSATEIDEFAQLDGGEASIARFRQDKDYLDEIFLNEYMEIHKYFVTSEIIYPENASSEFTEPYGYLVNLGEDVEISFRAIPNVDFQTFELRSNYGVRLWGSEGENTSQDIFLGQNFDVNNDLHKLDISLVHLSTQNEESDASPDRDVSLSIVSYGNHLTHIEVTNESGALLHSIQIPSADQTSNFSENTQLVNLPPGNYLLSFIDQHESEIAVSNSANIELSEEDNHIRIIIFGDEEIQIEILSQ